MVYTGILRKRSDILALWKYRYFMLTSNNELYYYEYEDGPLKGRIPLTKTTKVREYPFSMMENTFSIKDKRLKFEIFLWADSYEMMIGWINALTSSIERIESNNSKGQNKMTTLPSSSSSSSPVLQTSTSSPSSLNDIHPLPHPSSSPSIIANQHRPDSPSNLIIGECQCHAIKFIIHLSNPINQCFCHCYDCQQSSLSPFTCLAIFPSDSIEILKGNVFLGKYELTYRRYRYFCRQCASYLFFDSLYQFPSLISSTSSSSATLSQGRSPSSFIPTTPYTAILIGCLSNYSFEPTCHLMYSSHKMAMYDNLPKYRNIPPSWGGDDPSEIPP